MPVLVAATVVVVAAAVVEVVVVEAAVDDTLVVVELPPVVVVLDTGGCAGDKGHGKSLHAPYSLKFGQGAPPFASGVTTARVR